MNQTPAPGNENWNITEVRHIEAQAKGSFFSAGAKRFFRSRILPTVYQGPGGMFFLTSEQFDDNSPRLYTVRQYFLEWERREVKTVGDFNTMTKAQAIREAKRLAASAPVVVG